MKRSHALVALLTLGIIGCSDSDSANDNASAVDDSSGTSPTDDMGDEPSQVNDDDAMDSAGGMAGSDDGTTMPDDSSAADDDSSAADDATPTDAARGGVSIEIAAGCDIDAQIVNFPPSDEPVVTATEKLQSIGHGAPAPLGPEGETVRFVCNFTREEPPYRISVDVEYGAGDDERYVSFLAQGDIGERDVGTLVISGPPFPSPYGTRSVQCETSFIEVDPVAGSAWGQTVCPAIEPAEGADTCEVATSYFFVENCE
jgi:hypothetical protein